MSCTEEGSSTIRRGKAKKTDCGKAKITDIVKGSRRHWSPREEEVLAAALKELVAQGWKLENGFRVGYLNKLENAMKKEFPGTDLGGTPHIHSRITMWKRYYYSLTQILNQSGVGFNLKGTFMNDCEDYKWDQIVKSNSNANAMRYKPWPLLDDWTELFGKDRANGENAEDILDALNELGPDPDLAEDEAADYDMNLDDTFEADHGENSSVGHQPQPARKEKNKKQKSDDGIDTVCVLFSEFSHNTETRLDKLCNRIGYEHDLGKARKEVFELLGNIPGLSLNDKFDVCEILADKVERLEIFMGLPEEARPQYVHPTSEFKVKVLMRDSTTKKMEEAFEIKLLKMKGVLYQQTYPL